MEDFDGIIDDDPVLDIIMIEEMEKEGKREPQQPRNHEGCLGVITLILINRFLCHNNSMLKMKCPI